MIKFNQSLNDLRNRSRTGKGFTLIELVIVVAVIGILAAIAIPSYGAQQQKALEATLIADATTNAKNIAYNMATKYQDPGAIQSNDVSGSTVSVIALKLAATNQSRDVVFPIVKGDPSIVIKAEGKWDNYTVTATNTTKKTVATYSSLSGKATISYLS